MSSKKLTVGFFSPGWPLSNYPNGIVSYVENIISGFDKNSVDAVVLANSMAGDDKYDQVINLSKFSGNQLNDRLIDAVLYRTSVSDALRSKIGRGVIRAVKASGLPIDILEMEESFGASSLVVSKLSIPVVTRLHGPWFLMGDVLGVNKDSLFKRRVKLEGRVFSEFSAVTSPCKALLNQVKEYYQIDLPNAKVIPNPAPSITDSKLLWNIENCVEKVVLFVGRFDRHKGGDLVIDAFRIIASQDKEICLHFIGPDRGLIIDGTSVSVFEYIKQKIPEESISSRIIFFGAQNAEQISLQRRSALVTLIASRYENFPMTLLEALSVGSPVVATPVGGIPEVITEGFNGLLADQVSAEAIAEKVFLLINDRALMKSLSQNALEDCTKKYHPTVVANQTLEFYKSVIANKL